LAAERREVEERPDAAERFDAATGGRVREEHALAVAQEDGEREVLAGPTRVLEVLADHAASTSPCGA
jgi:hypothetical protein